MPKIRDTDFNIQTGNVASVTVVMPNHVAGDVLLVFAGKDDATGNGPTTATADWLVGGSGVSGGATTAAVRAAWFVREAVTDTPDLVITSSDADTWSILAISIMGAGISKTITGYTWSGGTTTYTSTSHGFVVGTIVNITGMTPSGANGIFVVTAVTTNTFNVVNADPGTYSSGGNAKCLIDAQSGNGNTDSTGAPFDINGVTTNYNKSLVFYACFSGGIGCPVHYPGLVGVGNVDSAAEGLGVACFTKYTAGATGAKSFYANLTNQNTIGFCVAVRDDGTGLEQAYLDSDWATLIHPFRGSSVIITNDVWGTALTNYPTTGKDAMDDVVVEDVGTGFTNYTTAANNATVADVLTCPATEAVNDYIAFGYEKPFMSLIFDRASCTAGAGGVVAWEYYNGSSWIALSSVTDATTSFTSAVADGQIVRWAMPPNFNWIQTSINGGPSLFYVRARVTTVYTTNPTVSQIFVGGIATVYDAVGASADAGVIQFEDASNITAASNTSQVGGTYIDLGQTVNLANTIIVGTFMFSLPRDYVDSARFKEGGGVHIFFADTSFNRKHWCLGSYLDNQTRSDKRNRFAIDWEQTVDTTVSRTTTDPSDTIADIFIGNLCLRGTGAVFFSHMLAVNPANIVVNGGSSGTPINVDELINLGNMSAVQLFRDNEFMVPVTFGGSDPMHCVLTDFTFIFPEVATPYTDLYNLSPKSAAHYDVGVLGFKFDARNGDTMKMTNGKISSNSTWQFTVLSTASSGATWDFNGMLLVNANVTLRSVFTWNNIKWQSCPSFVTNGATITNNIFVNTKVTVSSPAQAALISNSSFTKTTGTQHGIEIGGSVADITLTGITFTGYAVTDGSSGNEAIYVNIASGVITITIAGGGTIPSIRTAGATVTVVLAPVDTTITVKDITTGAPISGARVLVTASDNTGPMPYQKSTTLSRSGVTVTATCTSHGLITGKKALIKGANQLDYNGIFAVTSTGTNSFTYLLPDTGTGALTINVVASAGTFTRTTGNFLTDGFRAGATITPSGFTNPNNNNVRTILTVTSTVITVTDTTNLVDETGNNNERIQTTPTDPAVGTIITTGVVVDGTTNGSGIITDNRSHSSDQPIIGKVRNATTGTKYKTSTFLGTIDNLTGFSTTIQMIRDE